MKVRTALTVLSAGLLALGNAAIAGAPAKGQSISPTKLSPVTPVTVQWDDLVSQSAANKAAAGGVKNVELMRGPAGSNEGIGPEPALKLAGAASDKIQNPAKVFDSLSLETSPVTVIPPDTMGAVGPNHVVTTLNSGVRIHDRDGVTISTVSLADFWRNLGFGDDVFDPKIVYDPISRRFFMVSCAARRSALSAIVVAVSATEDPTGKWFLYRFDGDSRNTNWVDFPYLGFNRQFFAMSANMFTISGDQFNYSNVWVINKADLLTGGTINPSLFTPSTFSVALASTFSADEPNLYALSPLNNRAGSLQMFSIGGTAGAPEFNQLPFSPRGIAYLVGDFNATQPDTTARIDTADDRMGNVVYRNGHVWATHCVVLTTGFAAVRWYEIDPTDGRMIQVGTISGAASATHYYYPSIAVNKNNEVLIGFSGSSNKVYASAYYAYRSPNDEPGVMQGPNLIRAGEAPYAVTFGGSRVRWGDYSSTMVDPRNDAAFWTIQEYAATPSQDLYGGNWATVWANVPNELPAVAPKVVRVSSPSENKTYGTGMTILVDVQFDRLVSATGTPKLTLETGATDRQASLVKVEGNIATFSYTVARGDNSSDLDFAGTGALGPVGSLSDVSGNPEATLTLPAPGSENSLAAANEIRVDALGPSAVIGGTASSRREALPALDITFDEAPVNFDRGDITISLDGDALDLGDTNLVAVDDRTFRLEGLEGITEEIGVYRVRIGPADIKDSLGNAMTGTATFSWEFDVTSPRLNSIVALTTSPTSSDDIDFQANFSEPIASFDGLEDLVLTTTGSLAFSAAAITPIAPGAYRITLRNAQGTGSVAVAVATDNLTDVAGNALQANSLVSSEVAVDNSAPDVALTTEDATLTGSSIRVTFRATDTGGSALGATKFYVRREGSSFSQVTETLLPKGQFAYISETTDGVFEFGSASSDSLDNTKSLGGSELTVALNVKANSPFSRLVGSGEALPFPMTDTLDVLAVTDTPGGGSLSIGRLVGDEFAVPAALQGLPLFKEALVVERSFSEPVTITWPADPANRNGVTRVDTAWVVNAEGRVLGTYPASASGTTVTIRGLKTNATIYVGLNTKAAAGWLLQ